MAYQITNYSYGSAIQEICRLVGHPIPADAAGSTDTAVQQMGAAVNQALSQLLTLYEWQDLTKIASLSIVAGVPGEAETAFTLPEDFYRFIDQSQWGTDSQLPAIGPVSNQAWMQLRVRTASPTLTLLWQMRGDQLIIMKAPTIAVPLEFMYLSNAQVIDADVATTLKNVATKNGDTFILDSNLVMLLGRAKYLEWKGFDSSGAMRDFIIAFSSRTGANKGAQVLNIGRRQSINRLISPGVSLPDSGYGV